MWYMTRNFAELTVCLTSCRKVDVRKLIVTQRCSYFAVYGIWRFISMFTSDYHWSPFCCVM